MNQPLAARIAFFESHWAFMGGFGAVCTLATVATPFYVGAAVMAVLFPVFILMTFDTSPRHHMQRGGSLAFTTSFPTLIVMVLCCQIRSSLSTMHLLLIHIDASLRDEICTD